MSKEGSTESFLPKKLVRATSLVWLSLLLATGAAYVVGNTPIEAQTGFPGLDILLAASKKGHIIGNEDLFNASIIDNNSLLERFGKDLDFAIITAKGYPQGSFNSNQIVYLNGNNFTRRELNSMYFPQGQYILESSWGTKPKDITLTKNEQEILVKFLNKNVLPQMKCVTNINISFFNFSNTNKEAKITQTIYLHEDSEHVEQFEIFRTVNLISGEVKNYWGKSEEDLIEAPEGLSEILKTCG